jgi:glycosyltransferase involved in cell wall biosynthesis
MEKLIIIIPAYNEAKSISSVIKEVKKVIPQVQISASIVVIDDGSTDQTFKVAKREGVTVLRHIINLGYWGALQTGMLYGYHKGAEYFITLDADGQHLPEEIPKILTPLLKKEADVVIGSCIERGGFSKKLAWTFFRFLTGLKIKDLTSGFRAYNLKAVKLLIDYHYTIFDNADLASLLLLTESGCKIKEVSVQFGERLEGNSKLFSSPFKILKYLIYSVVISISQKRKRRPCC